MKNYLDFEKNIKKLEENLQNLKDPFQNQGLSKIETEIGRAHVRTPVTA